MQNVLPKKWVLEINPTHRNTSRSEGQVDARSWHATSRPGHTVPNKGREVFSYSMLQSNVKTPLQVPENIL